MCVGLRQPYVVLGWRYTLLVRTLLRPLSSVQRSLTLRSSLSKHLEHTPQPLFSSTRSASSTAAFTPCVLHTGFLVRGAYKCTFLFRGSPLYTMYFSPVVSCSISSPTLNVVALPRHRNSVTRSQRADAVLVGVALNSLVSSQ